VHERAFALYQSGRQPSKFLIMQARRERSGDFTERRVPVVLSGTTVKRPGAILNVRTDFHHPADLSDRDVQEEIPQSFTQFESPF